MTKNKKSTKNATPRPKQLIIIGGGYSITEGIDKGLWSTLEGSFTMGLNYSYHYYDSTLQSYVDHDFYAKNKDDLEALPLIVGKHHNTLKYYKNTIALRTTNKYSRDLSTGVYNSCLSGIFALSLGIYLLGEGEIYLLGYDYGDVRTNKAIASNDDYGGKTEKKKYPITHFYQGDIKHRGIGKVNYYNGVIGRKGERQPRADWDFRVYNKESKVKIYNVSINSKITVFPKLSYKEFFEKLSSERSEQEVLREMVRAKLEAIRWKEAK